MVVAQKTKPSKDEINFDSDEDLPGMDDSEKTPSDSPTPPTPKKPERQNSKGPSGDIFGDGDDLPDTGMVLLKGSNSCHTPAYVFVVFQEVIVFGFLQIVSTIIIHVT